MAALEKQKKADISRVIESAESRGGSREQYSISNRMVFYYTLMIIELNYEIPAKLARTILKERIVIEHAVINYIASVIAF